MKKIKITLSVFSTLSLLIIGLHLLRMSQVEVKAVTPPVKSNTLPLPRLQPELIKKFLDNKNINSAIIHIEQGWKQQYEEYIQKRLPSNQVFEVKKISQTLDQVSQRVNKKSALIYAITTPNHLDLILISPNISPIHKRIAGGKKDVLISLINQFRSDVVNPVSQRSKYQSSGKKIYDLLIAPVEAELRKQGVDTLIFCLGGGLRTVPLAAIYDGEKFLVEKYSLAIIPAFNLLDFQPTNITNTQVLAMGASEFKNLEPLPAVPLEISNIITKNWKGKALLNQDFTLKNLKRERAIYPFGIVHLATHAELSPGSVKQSYIQFWDTQVRLDELKTLELDKPPVQLLVLSACRTALGNSQAELGFAGLAVQSGAKAALASLWSVDDSGTLALMTQFYEQLKANPVKSEALRQAQIAMLKQQVSLPDNPVIGRSDSLALQVTNLDSQELSHPYYWSGFTLIGNPW